MFSHREIIDDDMINAHVGVSSGFKHISIHYALYVTNAGLISVPLLGSFVMTDRMSRNCG